jgi:hypothetical protein
MTFPALTKEEGNLKISRNDIINRAQDWVNRAIPYSQTDYTGTSSRFNAFYFMQLVFFYLLDGYRQDCSGMVSMAWASSTSYGGHSTYNMQVSE